MRGTGGCHHTHSTQRVGMGVTQPALEGLMQCGWGLAVGSHVGVGSDGNNQGLVLMGTSECLQDRHRAGESDPVTGCGLTEGPRDSMGRWRWQDTGLGRAKVWLPFAAFVTPCL